MTEEKKMGIETPVVQEAAAIAPGAAAVAVVAAPVVATVAPAATAEGKPLAEATSEKK